MERAERVRFFVVVGLLLVTAAAIATKLCLLQIVDSELWAEKAGAQHRRRIEVQPRRGAILDRHGRELAVSLATESLFAHPRRVADPGAAARLLAPVLDASERELLGRLRSGRPFVYLQRFMEPQLTARVRELGLPIGDSEPFGLLPETKRYYPRRALAGHVVGFASIDGVGLEGIEKSLDGELRGEPIVYLVTQDGRRGRLRRLAAAKPRQPRDVVLTIDSVLQHVVERELDRAVDESGARAASAVLLDASTGQVLALANRPAVDLNDFGRARAAARVNRAVVHQYEPGSTFKIVPMAAALELDRVRPREQFWCENGAWRLGPRLIRDASPHGRLSASEILQQSSNIGMVKIAQRLVPSELDDYIRSFGFGRATGIELPGEAGGTLRPLASRNAHSHASLAFGHEIAVTVLQMATAFAVLANDGVLVPPRLVLGHVDPSGELVPRQAPPARRVLTVESARRVTVMMEGTIVEGTGRRAGVTGYRLAGKSGTAQKVAPGGYSETEFVASFGGLAPVTRPRLVALVVLDTPRGSRHHGGQVAAPVFARIMADALRALRVPPDADEPALALRLERSGWPSTEEVTTR